MSAPKASHPSKASREAVHTGFLRHRGLLWAKVALLLCAISIAAYVWHTPLDAPNGGTWLGYTLGGISAALVLWLTMLGVRKRRYRSSLGTVKGWTSAHVYLGLSLIVIATLHSGFQFGLNIHTLSYALMMLVIASGLYGLAVYSRLPQQLAIGRAGSTREAWIEELLDLGEQALKLAEPLGDDVHRKVVQSVEKATVGGGLWSQLYGPRASAGMLDDFRHDLEQRVETLRKKSATPLDVSASRQNTVMFMAHQLNSAGKSEQELQRIQQLLDVLGRRKALVARINRDIALQTRLQVWLLVHVPLTFALIAALIAHVVSVFFYW